MTSQDYTSVLKSFSQIPASKGSYFLTLEGGEGCGKSEQLKRLEKWLKGQGHQVHVTREPGGTPLGEEVRSLLLQNRNLKDAPTSLAEALLFMAARTQHLEQEILPRLQIPGTWVLCDRYLDSSLVYQGLGRGLGVSEILGLHARYPLFYLPHLTLLFDVEREISKERVQRRSQEMDRLEKESEDFHEKVRQGFLGLKNLFPERIQVISSKDSREVVEGNVLKEVKSFLSRNSS